MIIRKNDKKVEKVDSIQIPDVKGEDLFDNAILALVFDIVFLVYSIIYSKFQMAIEYLFFMILFKVTAMGIGEKARNVYDIVQETPQFRNIVEVIEPRKVKNFVKQKIVAQREGKKKEG